MLKTFYNRKSYYLFGSAVLFIFIVIAFLLTGTGLLGPNGSIDVQGNLMGYNLILVNIDSLRADHMGCYGYHRNTSPFIDRLARKGVVFERAMSNSSFTLESVSVLFSGRLPSSGNSVGWGAVPSGGIKLMGELFKEAGYKTAFFSNTNVLHNSNFTRGFQTVYYRKKWGVSRKGPRLSFRAGKFIEKCRGQKFLIYLHYLDPHGPYNPPPEYYLRFAKTLYPKPLSLYYYVRQNCRSLMKKGFGPGDARYEDMVLRYDAEIAYIDKSIEILFAALRRNNLLNNTLVVITADHGEEFLEHMFVEHAWTLYNESLHVPLIFWAPGALKSKRFNSLVSTVDILPTLLHLMGIPNKRDDFDGASLFKHASDGIFFTPPKKPYIAELLIQHRNIIRAVIKDNWKYIAALKFLEPRERPDVLFNVAEFEENKKLHLDIWGPVIHEELYDLSIDPGEQRRVANKKKQHEMRAMIQKYKKVCSHKKLPTPLEDTKKHPLSQEDIKRLKTLGYL